MHCRADIPKQKMTFFVNIQSPGHLEMSLLAVCRRNAETRDPRAQHVVRVLSSSCIFHLEERPSNIDQTLIVACCPFIQLVPRDAQGPPIHLRSQKTGCGELCYKY